MTSTITLYKNTKILPEKNFKIDDLTAYLNSLPVGSSTTISNFQYIKSITEVSFDIKIDASQVYLSNEALYNYDYAKIVNSDNSRPYYYFITKKVWRSESCVMLHLVLDSINTFAISTDYTLSPKTKVLREHKDRFDIINSESSTLKKTLSSGEFTCWDLTIITNRYLHIEFSISKALLQSLGFNGTSATPLLITYKFTAKTSASSPRSAYSFSFRFPEDGDGANPCEEQTTVYYLRLVIEREYLPSNLIDILDESMDVAVTTTSRVLRRKIDLLSEGLTPILYKKELGKLYENAETTWNLIYKTTQILSEEESNPVDCFLIPDMTLNVRIANPLNMISAGDLTAGSYYYFVSKPSWSSYGVEDTTGDRDLSFSAGTKTFTLSHKIGYMTDTNIAVAVQQYVRINRNANNKIEVSYRRIITHFNRVTYDYIRTYEDVELDNAVVDNILVLNCLTGIVGSYESTTLYSGDDLYQHCKENYQFYLDTTLTYLMDFDEYDRTQSTLIKIIKCPYCPSSYSYDLGTEVFYINAEWEFFAHMYKLVNNNAKFKNTIITNMENPVRQALIVNDAVVDGSNRDAKWESKLFHSDFYQIKFVYDSFTYTIPLERLDLTRTNLREYFAFTFVMTTTMNSKFLFMFEDLVYSHSTEDYDNVLPVARNNEVVIYNSTYLNYLRTAYNYDLKAKERSIKTGAVGLGLSLVGSVTSGALGIASQNPAVAVSSVINAGSSITSQVMNYVNSIAQQEEAIESKKAILQSESVSVSGSDDLDLLEAYSDNKAKLCLYQVSARLKNALFDLFYYTGYTCNEMKVPSFNTRKYFNYIAMEIVTQVNTKAINEEILENIRLRWADGVTIIHNYNGAVLPKWDIEQTKENWEVSLL